MKRIFLVSDEMNEADPKTKKTMTAGSGFGKDWKVWKEETSGGCQGPGRALENK